MTQVQVLTLLIGMLNAFAAFLATPLTGGALPPEGQVIFGAVAAACGFGLMFLDKLPVGRPTEKPSRRKFTQGELDQIRGDLEAYLKRTPARKNDASR